MLGCSLRQFREAEYFRRAGGLGGAVMASLKLWGWGGGSGWSVDPSPLSLETACAVMGAQDTPSRRQDAQVGAWGQGWIFKSLVL